MGSPPCGTQAALAVSYVYIICIYIYLFIDFFIYSNPEKRIEWCELLLFSSHKSIFFSLLRVAIDPAQVWELYDLSKDFSQAKVVECCGHQTWLNSLGHRKTVGKPQENHRKTIRNPWYLISGDFLGKIIYRFGGSSLPCLITRDELRFRVGYGSRWKKPGSFNDWTAQLRNIEVTTNIFTPKNVTTSYRYNKSVPRVHKQFSSPGLAWHTGMGLTVYALLYNKEG